MTSAVGRQADGVEVPVALQPLLRRVGVGVLGPFAVRRPHGDGVPVGDPPGVVGAQRDEQRLVEAGTLESDPAEDLVDPVVP